MMKVGMGALKKHLAAFEDGVDDFIKMKPISEVEHPARMRAVLEIPPLVIKVPVVGSRIAKIMDKKFERMAGEYKDNNTKYYKSPLGNVWFLEYDGDADEVDDMSRSYKGKLASKATRKMGVECYIEKIGELKVGVEWDECECGHYRHQHQADGSCRGHEGCGCSCKQFKAVV